MARPSSLKSAWPVGGPDMPIRRDLVGDGPPSVGYRGHLSAALPLEGMSGTPLGQADTSEGGGAAHAAATLRTLVAAAVGQRRDVPELYRRAGPPYGCSSLAVQPLPAREYCSRSCIRFSLPNQNSIDSGVIR